MSTAELLDSMLLARIHAPDDEAARHACEWIAEQHAGESGRELSLADGEERAAMAAPSV